MSATDLQFAAQRSQCRSCGAPIIWTLTQNRKKMPMDAEPIVLERGQYQLRENDDGSVDSYLIRRLWISHFATCPESNEWRSKEHP